jgi:hypothetical protein
VLSNEHVIPYSEITQYRVQMLKGMPLLTLKSVHGITLNLNISAYDMTPLMRAIDFHQATGEWPVPATVPGRSSRGSRIRPRTASTGPSVATAGAPRGPGRQRPGPWTVTAMPLRRSDAQMREGCPTSGE